MMLRTGLGLTRVRIPAIAAWLAALLLLTGSSGWAMELRETPIFQDAVAAGELPPVGLRLPNPPAVAQFTGGRAIGRHGGRRNIGCRTCHAARPDRQS